MYVDLRSGTGFGNRKMHELFESAYDTELIVWIHTDQKDASIHIDSVEFLIQKHPGVKIILSSMFRNTVYLMKKFKTIYTDTIVFELRQDRVRMRQPIGAHRILIGSNTPYGLSKHEMHKI